MRRKLKGFTLIELIIVIAIFGVIMAAALSLMMPASKVMTNAETQENGNAAVSSISEYLEGQLATAEYLQVYPKMDDTTIEGIVSNFTNAYYTGILKADATTSTPAYGKGKIHVLQVDNEPDANGNMGKIKSWVYNIGFEPGAAPTLESYTDSANNNAYYDSYIFQIEPGSFASTTKFNAAFDNDGVDDVTLNSAYFDKYVAVKNTCFTIKALTKYTCPKCKKVLTPSVLNEVNAKTLTACPDCSYKINRKISAFVTTSPMTLLNIYNRGNGAVENVYYVIDQRKPDGEGVADDARELAITDRSKVEDCAGFAAGIGSGLYKCQKIHAGKKVFTSTDGINEADYEKGFTFIYSYGPEMDTQ